MMTAIFFQQFTNSLYSIFNRHNLVDAVIGSYGTIMAAQRGEVVCEVITAKVRNGHIVFINLHILIKKLIYFQLMTTLRKSILFRHLILL